MKEAILEIQNLYKSFGIKKIHQNLNLTLYKGESVALLGGSGTGKSVLLRQIIGLEKIDQGKILFNKMRIDNLNEENLFEVRKRISFSFQSGALFDSSTVFENIAFPLFEHTKLSLSEIKLKVSEMLKLIDMEGTEQLMPSDLSGGMQKRVGMARSMILEPEIVLYDEPTAGLDPSNTENIVSLMKRLRDQGLTSIFVTHDIASAINLCDRIVILFKGKIYFDASPNDFLNSKDPVVTKFHIYLNSKRN